MGKNPNKKRKLVNITLEEAVKVIQLGEGFYESANYQLRTKTNEFDEKFAQLFYVSPSTGRENIAANFSDSENAVKLCLGNEYYRIFYRIIKYLEKRGFDLASADRE